MSGQSTSTSLGRNSGSAVNRWPRTSRSTSSWRVAPWQAWTWSDETPGRVLGRTGIWRRRAVASDVALDVREERGGRRCVGIVVAAPGRGAGVLDPAQQRGGLDAEAAPGVDEGVAGLVARALVVRASRHQPSGIDWRRARPTRRRRGDDRQRDVADRGERRDDLELGRSQGADAEHRDDGRQRRLDRRRRAADGRGRAAAQPGSVRRHARGPHATGRTATATPGRCPERCPRRHRRHRRQRHPTVPSPATPRLHC